MLDRNIDVTRIYLHEIGFEKLLTAQEEIDLSLKAQEGDIKSREKIINGNLRLVVKTARGYLHRGLPLGDLIEEGNLGLIKAVERFDPHKGFRFSTYATWWIRQSIEKAIMDHGRTVRLPVYMLKKMASCLRAFKEMSSSQEHEPRKKEIADKLDLPLQEVDYILGLIEGSVSVDSSLSAEGSNTLLDLLSGEEDNQPENILAGIELNAELLKCLDELPEKHRQVLIGRFGLNGKEQGTLEEVGLSVGLTRERVRQIQLEALDRLRDMLEN